MTAPCLNRKLVLEDAYRVPDGAGGFTQQWQTLGHLWAEIQSGTGRAVGENGAALSRNTLKIRVRSAPVGAPSRPQAGQRLREGTRVYVITAVRDDDMQGRFLICQAQEEIAT